MKTTANHGITALDDGRFLVMYYYTDQQIIEIGKFQTRDEAHAAFTGASVALMNRFSYLRQKENND